jgi:hypothetical protein
MQPDTEVTYRFIRGTGWVPSTEDDTFVCYYVDYDGVTWRVHDRKPNVGEHWSVLRTGETIFKLLEWYTRYQEPIGPTAKWESHFANTNSHYITFLPA